MITAPTDSLGQPDETTPRLPAVPRDLAPLFPRQDATEDAAIAKLCARWGYAVPRS